PRSVPRTPVRPAPGPGPGGSGSRWAGPHLCRPPTRPAPPLLTTWERTEPMSALRDAALDYHRRDRPGKLAVVPTKPVSGQNDLALAYTPGVGEAVRAIAARPDDAYEYTSRANLVAVVTNGTAVLGLGDVGPLAA